MERSGQPLNILVVDDSAVMRQMMTAVLNQGGMNVTVAADPYIALAKMRQLRPDVILLDLEMPRMDGLSFLRKIMAEDPIPVVICSGLATRGTELTIRALEEGAVDVITKPKLGIKGFLQESATMLIDTLRGAAQARLRPGTTACTTGSHRAILPPLQPSQPRPIKMSFPKLVAIGASTGGTEALRELLEAMPDNAPGMVIVQHMPAGFTAAFAKRLNQYCRLEVKEAEDGDTVAAGNVLVAPGNRHIELVSDRGHYAVILSDGPPVCHHRPSVDVLFHSVARVAGRDAVGVILTGMGKDGAAGLLEMKRAGAKTIAQDEATSVVFGMPKEAIACGAADKISALGKIPQLIMQTDD